MAVQRSIWKQSFKDWPQLPCPSCKVGVLTINNDSISKEETASSKASHSHEDWDPDWMEERFSAALTCSNPTCQDRVYVCGIVQHNVIYFHEDDGSTGIGVDVYFRPHFFEPAPPVFPIPGECPKAIQAELLNAFSLYWSDIASAGNRMRVAVEALMNERGVQKKAKIKNGRRKGKFRNLDLHDRIERFQAVHKEAATQLMAVK